MTNRFSRRAIARALLTTTALVAATPALAQLYNPPAIPPIRATIDQNGVDLTSGTIFAGTHSVSIGPAGAAGISWSRILTGSGSAYDSTAIVISISGSVYTVSVGGRSESFTLSGSDYVSNQKTGSTLVLSGSNFIYTTRDGTVYTLVPVVTSYDEQYRGSYHVSSITYPTGEVWTFNWELVTGICHWNEKYMFCADKDGERLRSVTSTAGYKLAFTFELETPPPDSPGAGWAAIATVQAQNMSVDPASQSWPTLSFTGLPFQSTTITATDSLNRTTTYNYSAAYGPLVSVKRPGASSNNESIGWNANSQVSSVLKDGVSTSYAYSTVGSTLTTTVTDANSHTRVVNVDTTTGLVSSDTDELGKTTSYTYYSGSGLLNTVTAPEGNGASFVYDGRGNLTQTTLNPKAGSGLTAIVTSASYPASDPVKTWQCASGTAMVICNKPTSTTDAKGNVTNYAWDTATGLPTSITKPAPTTGAVQPQTRYSYSSVYAQYLSGGSLVNFATPVTRLTGISQCQTNSSCAGTADEAKSTITYGTANALPVSLSSGAGDGSLTATNAFTYDTIGNRLTVDGPLSGTADTTMTRYDADREVIGKIDPDPDGAGPLKMRAVRLTYNADGQVTKTELGTVNSQSDADWVNFATSQEVDTSYDSNARPITQSLVSGGTTYALTQASYDSMGRLDCSAVRMNSAIYGSLPASSCTLGTQGSYGPDRITKMTYDADSRPTKATVAYGTSDQADERTLAYSDNGQVASLTDGENNKTTYVYDGFDRLSQTQYPSSTKGAGTSNSSDYEQLGYDANSNATSLRVRDGSSIALTYDNLNRVTFKDLPGTELDVTYAYDNLDRVTSASQTGNNLTFTYDALSRNLSQGGPQGTVNLAWDVAGRRTRVTHQDGYYVDYDYLVTDDVSKVRENGATSGLGVLATYGYDDLRRRTSVTFGNSTSTAYGYDPVSRLTSLTYDFVGTTNDLTKTFSYNPASQIVSETRSNDLFASASRSNENTSTTTNGLNEIASKGGTSFSFDSKGNLTSDGTTTYTYDSQNQFKTVSGTAPSTLTYDPLGRTWENAAGTGATRYAYEGADALTQQDQTGTYWRRYVHGPGLIEPIVQYQDQNAVTRRFLATDERGSVIALSDDSGNVINVNRYDEYGVSQSGNAGGFGFAGQRGFSTANNDNARYYRPGEGVFMQTDPIGPQDDSNLYQYTGNDPVNFVDPSGLAVGAPGATIRCGPNEFWDELSQSCSINVNGSRSPYSLPGGTAWGNPRQPGNTGECLGGCEPIVIRGHRRKTLTIILPTPIPVPVVLDQQCATRTLRKNGIALGIDILGLAADIFLAPEAGAVAAIGLGGAAIVNSSAHKDAEDAFVGYVGMKSGTGVALLSGRSAKISHGVSRFMLGVSSLHDSAAAYSDYKNCLAGR